MKKYKIPKTSEHDAQKAIIEYLKYDRDVYWMRNNSFAGKIMRPDGSTGWVNNAKKGAPDIVLCKNGLWIGLEIKCRGGRQSPDQKQAEADIRKAGGQYYIIHTIDDLTFVLNNI